MEIHHKVIRGRVPVFGNAGVRRRGESVEVVAFICRRRADANDALPAVFPRAYPAMSAFEPHDAVRADSRGFVSELLHRICARRRRIGN